MFHFTEDFDRAFSSFNELRRQLDSAFLPMRRFSRTAVGWPRASVVDKGTALVVRAEVPGVAQGDLDVTLHDGTLTLRGKRATTVPQGYSVHRQERGPLEFSRSFVLPSKVDPERVSARLEDGFLTVELVKAADAQPRQISVQAQ